MKKVTILVIAAVLLFVIAAGYASVSNFGAIHIRDANPTGVPALQVNQRGSGKIVEFTDGGTPVFSVNNGGGWSASGAPTFSGGLNQNNWVAIAVPTTVLTTTPAVQINSAGLSTNILDVQDGGTSQLTVLNGGGVEVAAPTAVGTAQPAFQVDSSGGLSNLLEVRDSATPVFTVSDGGNVTGKVLRYATAGTQIVCGTQTITDTADVSHGLTTPAYGMCSLNQTLTGDAYACNATVAGATVTVKVLNNAATPAANAAGASVNWCVVGTP